MARCARLWRRHFLAPAGRIICFALSRLYYTISQQGVDGDQRPGDALEKRAPAKGRGPMENALLAALSRRNLLRQAGVAGLATFTSSSWAQSVVNLPLPGGVDERQITTSFPQKGRMILERTRPPLLETPFEVFDKGVFTPNDEFFVRWHWAVIPTSVDVREFRLNVHGHVDRPLSLTLKEVLALPHVEYAAVKQCSRNSRGLFWPRVRGGEWGNGAMGNALWTGVSLKAVLDRAGVKAGAVQVRFNGMDEALGKDGPDFIKSLPVDHARDC